MTTYVCLLRGINVGGKNIIAMAALVKTFERMKLSNVKTFIASGNVVFAAPAQDLRKLEQKIEKQLVKDFDYDATVVVKSKDEMDAIVRGLPKAWAKATAAWRYNVIFLRHAVDNAKVLQQVKVRDGVETLEYKPGVLYWAVRFDQRTKSTVARLNQTALYKEVTIRNLNTTKKLAQLLEEGDDE